MQVYRFRDFGRLADAVNAPSADVVAAQHALSNQMDAVLRELTGALNAIQARIDRDSSIDMIAVASALGTGGLSLLASVFTSTSQARVNAKSQLNTYRNIVERLNTSSFDAVIVGDMDVKKWLASAETVRKAAVEALQVLNDSSWYHSLVATWDSTAATLVRLYDDLAEALARVGKAAKRGFDWALWVVEYWPFVLGGAGVLYFVWKNPRPRRT